MIYNLSYDKDIERFKSKVSKLLNIGYEVVELTEKKQRSLSQNNYLYLILGWFSLEYGCTIEEVKIDFFKRTVNRELFEVPNPKREGTTRLRSTADITKEEMSRAIDRFRNWSSMEAGIYIPSAGEREFLEHIQREISRNTWI